MGETFQWTNTLACAVFITRVQLRQVFCSASIVQQHYRPVLNVVHQNWCHDIQQKNSQNNATQDNGFNCDSWHNDTQHNNTQNIVSLC
jgi:hypothetical protein